MNPGELKHRVDVYGRVEIENELGEKDYAYDKIKSVWAKITPGSGSVQNGEGNTSYADITHRLVVRKNAIEALSNDMYFVYKGQRYNIKYFYPSYKYGDYVEIMASLVVE